MEKHKRKKDEADIGAIGIITEGLDKTLAKKKTTNKDC